MLGSVAFEIDYEAAEHPHQQIAAWLRQRIRGGEFAPGQRLPTERRIQEETGAAATTTRRAMRLLVKEGLVRTVPSRGNYVRPREEWNRPA